MKTLIAVGEWIDLKVDALVMWFWTLLGLAFFALWLVFGLMLTLKVVLWVFS